jgi:hypothetical protein
MDSLKEGNDMTDRIAHGGKTLYGARLGILTLDTVIPSMPGCGRNALTWPFPVLFGVVPGATVKRAVQGRGKGLLDAFLVTADMLIAQGADGIATSGGFCSLFQADLSAHCKVPVATSSLMQIPWVQSLLPPGKRVGVITVHGATLDAEHLEAASAPADTPVIGTEGRREISRVLLNGEPTMDVAAAELDMLDAGQELVSRHPEVGAVVLECFNFAPYAAALRDSLGMPVYSVYSFLTWFHAGLAPRDFGHPGSAPRDYRER